MNPKKDAQVKEPVDSISDDISQAIEETETEATDTAADEQETATTETPAGEEAETASENTEAEPEASTESEDDIELNVPEHWSEQDKTEFAGIKDRKTALSFVERRYKEMESGVTKKFQEIASIRKKGEALEEVLAQHRGEYNLHGMDDVAAVRQLFTIYSNLKSNPQGTIQWLANQYGVELGNSEEGRNPDPALLTLNKRIEELQRQQSQSTQQLHLRTQQELQTQIDAFKSAKDEGGNLKHPHFDDVRTTMGQLIQSGLATNMDDAYTKAVSLRPDLKPLVTIKKPDLSKADAATKAKKAASGVKSAGTAVKTTAPQARSLRDDIMAAIGDNDIRI